MTPKASEALKSPFVGQPVIPGTTLGGLFQNPDAVRQGFLGNPNAQQFQQGQQSLPDIGFGGGFFGGPFSNPFAPAFGSQFSQGFGGQLRPFTFGPDRFGQPQTVGFGQGGTIPGRLF
jgi:hypothetical protein